MACLTRADAEIAVLTGVRIGRTGVGIFVGLIDHNGCREAVA